MIFLATNHRSRECSIPIFANPRYPLINSTIQANPRLSAIPLIHIHNTLVVKYPLTMIVQIHHSIDKSLLFTFHLPASIIYNTPIKDPSGVNNAIRLSISQLTIYLIPKNITHIYVPKNRINIPNTVDIIHIYLSKIHVKRLVL